MVVPAVGCGESPRAARDERSEEGQPAALPEEDRWQAPE